MSGGEESPGGEEVNKVGRRSSLLGSFEAKKMCVSRKHCDFCQMLLKGQTAVNGPVPGTMCNLVKSSSLQGKSGWEVRKGRDDKSPNSFMGFCMKQEERRGRGQWNEASW